MSLPRIDRTAPDVGEPGWLYRPLQSLRPFAWAAVWLLLLEVLLRITWPPDERVLAAPLPIYGCANDDELERLVATRAHEATESALDIVLIGDSVLGSVENGPGERLVDVLEPALKRSLLGRPVRIFNLSVGGARAADVYGALRRMELRLSAQPAKLRNLVVVLSSNIIFFSRRHSQPPMLFPCLLDDIPGQEALRKRLDLPLPPRPAERWLAQLLSRNLYLFQQRRRLAEVLFGGPPRPMLREGLKHGFTRRHASRSTAPIESYARYAPNYDFIPLDSALALNYQSSQELAHWLAATPDLKSLVVMTPHNHDRLGAITDTDAYRATSAGIAEVFRGAGVRFVSYDHDADISADMFLDLDHLTAAGNQALAERLARELADLAGLHPIDSRGATVR